MRPVDGLVGGPEVDGQGQTRNVPRFSWRRSSSSSFAIEDTGLSRSVQEVVVRWESWRAGREGMSSSSNEGSR